MNWRSFELDPPYDAYEDDKNGYETDFEYCWFTYRYLDTKWRDPEKVWVSHGARKFSQGIFEGYESHMKTSPYPEDRIEVLQWVNREEVYKLIMDDFIGHIKTKFLGENI